MATVFFFCPPTASVGWANSTLYWILGSLEGIYSAREQLGFFNETIISPNSKKKAPWLKCLGAFGIMMGLVKLSFG